MDVVRSEEIIKMPVVRHVGIGVLLKQIAFTYNEKKGLGPGILVGFRCGLWESPDQF